MKLETENKCFTLLLMENMISTIKLGAKRMQKLFDSNRA
jgi:hypothetical protein